MEKQKSLKLNFIMNVILTMSTFLFPLITFPYVSRILLPSGTGKVQFVTSVITYFNMFAQLGIPIYGIRVCAKVRDNKKELSKNVQELFIINLIMSILAYAIFFIALFNISRLMQEKGLFLIVSFTILFNAIGMEWLYKALEQYTYITIRSIILKFIAMIAIFLLIREQKDYVLYGGISILATSASNVLNFFNVHRYVSLKPIGHYNIKRHFRAIFVFFAMSCATTIYTNLDTVMLGFMKTDEDVGYYNAAIKIKTILASIVTSLGVVLLPRASYYIEHDMKNEFLSITRKAINFVILVSTPMMLYFMFFAKEGILFLSGSAYEGSITPMQIIMPTLLFIGLTNIMGIQMLIPLGKERIVLYSEIAGAIVDVIINIILIPKMASLGATIGTLIAEAVVWIIQFISLYGLVVDSYKQIRYIPLLLALVLSSAGSFWIKVLELGNFLTLLISAVLFFGIYSLVLTIAKEPLILEVENQILRKIKLTKN